ncbi:MAG: hypothetical protein Q8M08_16190 [Bacteroidales bacterium]|nr:hypothetical protein [Bacteroidales bacterium]
MKKNLSRFLLLVLIMLCSAAFNFGFSQPQPPPPPSQHGAPGNQGGAAPITGDMEISLLLAALYGGFIIYKMRKKEAKVS